MKNAFDKHAWRPQRDFEIFVDMDDVLTDFTGHARAHGMLDDKGEPLFDKLTYDWWRSMPAAKGARAFYQALKKHGNVRVLSAPVLSADSFGAKADWMTRFIPERGIYNLIDLILCPAADKKFFAGPNHILIDDRQKNIDAWIAAGGIGILHKGDFADTTARMKQAMADFKKPPQSPAPVIK